MCVCVDGRECVRKLSIPGPIGRHKGGVILVLVKRGFNAISSIGRLDLTKGLLGCAVYVYTCMCVYVGNLWKLLALRSGRNT